MKKISSKAFRQAGDFIKENGRELEKRLFGLFFSGGEKKDVLNELKKYQNKDGGFGQALEPDFRMPFSSPLATSIGLRIITEINGLVEGKGMVEKAIRYLENTYIPERQGWLSVTPEVNDFAHTPWWNWDKEKGMTIIDLYWGNPSAEITAYIVKYRDMVKKIDPKKLIEKALKNIENRKTFDSEHEIYCYLKLINEIEGKEKKRLEVRLKEGIKQLVEYDRNSWRDYVPMPLNFISSKDEPRFGIKEEKIQENLDFFIVNLEERGHISPPWGDSFYEGEFKEAVREWEGILTLDALKTLSNFSRLNLR